MVRDALAYVLRDLIVLRYLGAERDELIVRKVLTHDIHDRIKPSNIANVSNAAERLWQNMIEVGIAAKPSPA